MGSNGNSIETLWTSLEMSQEINSGFPVNVPKELISPIKLQFQILLTIQLCSKEYLGIQVAYYIVQGF